MSASRHVTVKSSVETLTDKSFRKFIGHLSDYAPESCQTKRMHSRYTAYTAKKKSRVEQQKRYNRLLSELSATTVAARNIEPLEHIFWVRKSYLSGS